MMKKNEIFKKFFSYATFYKFQIAGGILILLVVTIANVITPIIVGKVINIMFSKTFVYEILLKLTLLYIIVNLIRVVGNYIMKIAFEKVVSNIIRDIRKDFYEHVMSLPMRYFDDLSPGEISARITGDTKKLKTLFSSIFLNLIPSSILCIAYASACIWIDLKNILFFIIIAPMMFFAYKKFFTTSYNYSRKSRSLIANMNAKINENIKNIEVIQSFNLIDSTYEKFDEISMENYETGLKQSKLFALNFVNLPFVAIKLGYVFVIISASVMYMRKAEINVGLLYTQSRYLTFLFMQIMGLMFVVSSVLTALASAANIQDVFDLNSEKDGEIEIDSIKEIEFSNVSFSYTDKEVLKNISFKIKPNESVAFVGHTGSGKTTIINLIMRFYDCNKGLIKINGMDIKKIKKSSLREHMAIVLQEQNIFCDTLRENINLGKNHSDEEIIKVFHNFNIDYLLSKHKKGLSEKMQESRKNLSRGEKQILSFVRAYLNKPDVLILDEATSNIDTLTESYIQNALIKNAKERTSIIIAHRLSTIHFCDHIIVLDDGKLVEEGSHETLMDKRGIYYELYKKET